MTSPVVKLSIGVIVFGCLASIGRLVYDGALALKCDSGRGSFQIEWRIFL